jgi:hypothetical protein
MYRIMILKTIRLIYEKHIDDVTLRPFVAGPALFQPSGSNGRCFARGFYTKHVAGVQKLAVFIVSSIRAKNAMASAFFKS